MFLFKMSDTETDSESDKSRCRIRSVTYKSHLHVFKIDIKSHTRTMFRDPN